MTNRITIPFDVTYSKSRGANSYGWNVVTLKGSHLQLIKKPNGALGIHDAGPLKVSAKGGGYDLLGTCVSSLMGQLFGDRLDALGIKLHGQEPFYECKKIAGKLDIHIAVLDNKAGNPKSITFVDFGATPGVPA